MREHHGDSPAKKLVRLAFWQQVRKKLGQARFERGPHLVILSKEAGDISVLTGLGAHQEGIFGVDTDHHAVANAAYRYRNQNYHFAELDVAEALDTWGELKEAMAGNKGHLASALIDLCAPLREQALTWLFQIAVYSNYFGYEFQIGRENGWIASTIEDIKKESEVDTVGARIKLFQMFEPTFNLKKNWFYRSDTTSHLGRPMCLVSGKFEEDEGHYLEPEEVIATWHDVVVKNDELKRQGMNPELCLNVDKLSIHAWRAHDTRGTYRKPRTRG